MSAALAGFLYLVREGEQMKPRADAAERAVIVPSLFQVSRFSPHLFENALGGNAWVGHQHIVGNIVSASGALKRLALATVRGLCAFPEMLRKPLKETGFSRQFRHESPPFNSVHRHGIRCNNNHAIDPSALVVKEAP
ncbi:hypothetical protein LZK98_11940 [Sphingomonas cannabina]|uniref:hypothetical protein n=1 Tax=Sphingomonas cannabina TaxID=2899123 RepID=UPI001F454DE2|nr:hypothetical protein [Sphingomonas cannabina]UIJ43803.1 hypothetical protein LZK98_11940 [Sphingomonas cannabina]